MGGLAHVRNLHSSVFEQRCCRIVLKSAITHFYSEGRFDVFGSPRSGSPQYTAVAKQHKEDDVSVQMSEHGERIWGSWIPGDASFNDPR